ncbi:MAG: hypothetical protein WC310_00235 [Patescibacteria group bacterium]|jgi:hypothetical protein
MPSKKEEKKVSYPIKPSDINAESLPLAFSGNEESKKFITALILLAQKNGDWRDFYLKQLTVQCRSGKFERFFVSNGLIKKNADKTYSFTHGFVARCFVGAPATEDLSLWRKIEFKK